MDISGSLSEFKSKHNLILEAIIMTPNNLPNLFRSVAAKRLSAVEAGLGVSHQHEFHGVSELKDILGLERIQRLEAQFFFLNEDEDILTDTGYLTWYNAREQKPTRPPEYRLYYSHNAISDHMATNDLLVIGMRNDASAVVIIAQHNTQAEREIQQIFGLVELEQGHFTISNAYAEANRKLGFAEQAILTKLAN